MRVTVDISDQEMEDAIRFTGAKTGPDAVVRAVRDFNRRSRMAELTRYAGTCVDLISPEQLQATRRRG